MTADPGDTASEPDAAAPADDATWSASATGSHAIDRELQRQLVAAALFANRTGPRIGRFAIAERLGAGASSVVYSAWDEFLARWVAVKLFVADSSATRDQVQREARALARLSHPNVVAVYDAGEWNDRAFIAMELVSGTTLSRWQAERKRPIAELLDAYLQAGRGLAAAHQAGLVHRDFKPANVMVAGDGRVVVTDFGLVGGMARDPGALDEPGSASTTRTPIGTPAYVAPEQRRGAAPHPSADIYSFSIALCEALIGWHPMRAPDAWSRALARRVPRRIHRAICAGLAAQPAARGDTMAALLDALAPRRRSRRVAAIAIAGVTAAATAAALRLAGPAARPEPVAQPVFAAPSHRAVIREIDAWLATPERPDPRGAAALRALVLAPLATELVCDWPAPPAVLAFTSDHAIGVDDQGRVLACALDSGAISLVADDARCAISGPDGLIGIVDRAARARVVRAGAAGWQPVAATGEAYDLSNDHISPRYCPILVLPAQDGGARVMPSHTLVAVDRAARIEASATESEIRIVDRAGRELASRAIARSPYSPQLEVSRDGARVLVVPLHGPLSWWQADTGQWHDERPYFDMPTLTRVRLSPNGRRALLVNEIGGLEVRTLGGGRIAWLTSDPVRDAVFRDDDTVVAADIDGGLWRWDLAAQRSGVVAVHRRAVWSVASNAEVIASGSEDGTAIVVDHRTGMMRLELDPGTEIYRVLLDGDRLITAGNDGLRRWDWRTGVELPLADGRGLRIWDVQPAATGDGARGYLAGALAGGAIFAWDADQRIALRSGGRSARISNVAVGPDGRIAAVDSGGRLVVLDAVTRRPSFQVEAHHGWARHVAFDPATATLVTIGDDGYLRSWSPPERAPRHAVLVNPNRSPVYGLDVQRGRAVTASYDGSVALVDLATGEIVRRYRGHTGAVRSVRFRADGQWFATGDQNGRVCLWQIDDEDCHTWLDGHRAAMLDVEFGDDGTIFTTSNDGVVRYWKPIYDQPVGELRAQLAHRRTQR